MILSALTLILGGCAPLGASPDDSAACDRQPPLSYERFGQGVLSKQCTGCHSSYLPEGSRYDAPLGVDFDTYQGVLDWGERILVRTVEERTMPLGGGLSEEELALFEEWLVCGVLPDAERLAAEEDGR